VTLETIVTMAEVVSYPSTNGVKHALVKPRALFPEKTGCFCYNVVKLFLHCCHTIVTVLVQMSHCCYTVVTLLSHCRYTIVTWSERTLSVSESWEKCTFCESGAALRASMGPPAISPPIITRAFSISPACVCVCLCMCAHM
jgi:hypothetical protein